MSTYIPNPIEYQRVKNTVMLILFYKNVVKVEFLSDFKHMA